MPRYTRYSASAKEAHRIWQLRHSACKKCHGESSDPCICGPEPCKNCGEANSRVSLNEWGCDNCVRPDYPLTIDIEGNEYWIVVLCPYCNAKQFVRGHRRGHHPDSEILECVSCHKRAWMGEDTEANSEYDIDDEEADIEIGHLSLGGRQGDIDA